MPAETLIHNTPLAGEHAVLGAKMVVFGGWNMPLQYAGILAEWEDNRKRCSIFDCSHMGEFIICGDAVACGLDRIVTQTITDMPPLTCRYGAMLNAQGGVIDDCIVYRLTGEAWMMVVNAANIAKDAAHVKAHLSGNAPFRDASFETAKIDVQGPLSRDVLKSLAPGIERLSYYGFAVCDVAGVRCIVSRTGYTGELGYEIYCPWGRAVEIWCRILKDPVVKPTGLGVRDVLRIEMCYSLYGHELEENISPLEAGLDKFIDANKDFIGKEALLRRKETRNGRTVGYFVSGSRKSPRAGNTLYNEQGRAMGTVTSGTFSPGLNAGVGIGFFEKGENVLEKKIFFGDDKTKTESIITRRPFYKNGSLKQ